jgi:sugar lactone lactonase YvrE
VSSGLAHPTSPAWGTLNATAITTGGDWLVQDSSQGALYEFPVDGSAMITLLAPGTMGADPGFALDSNNTLYLEGNWANCILRFPYDPSTKTWVGLSALSPANGTSGCMNSLNISNWPDGEWGIQPKGMTVDSNNDLIVGSWNDPFVARIPVTVNNGVATPGTPTIMMHSAKVDIISIAVDRWNNVYFVEDQSQTGAVPGVLEIPAGSVNIAGESTLARIDPNLPAVTAVATDPEGNVYASDGSLGVFMIPAAAGPATNPQTGNAVLLTPNAAQGSVSIDWTRQILYVPTTTTQSNGQADVAKVQLGMLDLGSSAVGTATAGTPVSYVFNGSVTPASFAIEEAGGTVDFAIANGGTCKSGTGTSAFTYSLGGACTVNLVANPNSAGTVSAKLLMLDASNNVLASTSLHGIGLDSSASVSPALESGIGTGFMTPAEVAVDATGNTYVADAGLGKVLMYAKGSGATTAGVSIGTGLTAPTGVAVDGAGDVLIADSGNIIEVPYGPSGLNAAGQVTLRSGLGSKLKLAADGLGSLYVTDPDNARVVKLGLVGATSGGMLSPELDISGFTAPAAVTVDASNNAYVLDNQNLIELQEPAGTQTTVVSSLGAATGLAIDASGAVYATLPGGTVRIPSVSGVLTQSALTAVAASVTNPTGVAIDKSGNVYVADQGAEDLHLVSINGALSFGTVSGSTPQNVSLLNIGNSSLTVTGFVSSDIEDFSAAGCSSPVNAGSTCDAVVTLNPGPGIQGPISSTITVQGNQSNAPVVISAVGTGGSLAGAGATISVASSANVISIPVTVTVAPVSGSGAPTGAVIITVDGKNPTNATLSNGTVTVTLTGIPAGSHVFAVQYIGDRTYGSTTASTTATVAKATVTLAVPAIPQYVLSLVDGDIPYDSSLQSYYENYVVTVNGAAGLSATGTMSFMQNTSVVCGAVNLGTPAAGEATFQPGCLPVSANTNTPNELTAQSITSIVYSGDANYLPATATTTTAGAALTFGELRQPSVSISPNPGTMTVTSGTGSAQLGISSVLGYGVSTNPSYPSSTPTLTLNNYTLPVGFACQGLPAYATCAFSGGNYVDLNGTLHPDEAVVDTDPSKPVSITVTINTNVSLSASNRLEHSPIAFAVLFGIGLIGLASRRRFSGRVLPLTLTCFIMLGGAALGLTSCSSNSTTTSNSNSTTTPSGSYTVSITAQQVGSITVLGNTGTPITLYGNLNQVSLPYTLNVTVQ